MDSLIKRALKNNSVASYEGMCGEAADAILREAGEGSVLYVEATAASLRPTYDTALNWKYHQVAVVKNRVYDPWYPGRPCSVKTYLKKVFSNQCFTAEIFREDSEDSLKI